MENNTSKQIKYLDDYLDKVCEKFPDIPRKDVKKVLHSGLRSFYSCIASGGDVAVRSRFVNMYVTRIFSCPLEFINYWRIKIRHRIRRLLYDKEFDGYYYFSVSEDVFKKFKRSKKKKFNFGKCKVFKLQEELDSTHAYKYAFKVKHEKDKYAIWYDDFTPEEVEYLGNIDNNVLTKFDYKWKAKLKR